MAHITGGGLTDNLPRILPDGHGAVINRQTWRVPPLFEWLQRTGNVPDADMLRTFNMGLGLIVVCGPADADPLIEKLAGAGEPGAVRIGEIQAGAGVTYA